MHLGIGVRYSEHDKAEREEISFKGGAPTEVLSKNENVFVRTRITNMINQWRFGADVILFYRGTYLRASVWLLMSIVPGEKIIPAKVFMFKWVFSMGK